MLLILLLIVLVAFASVAMPSWCRRVECGGSGPLGICFPLFERKLFGSFPLPGSFTLPVGGGNAIGSTPGSIGIGAFGTGNHGVAGR